MLTDGLLTEYYVKLTQEKYHWGARIQSLETIQ